MAIASSRADVESWDQDPRVQSINIKPCTSTGKQKVRCFHFFQTMSKHKDQELYFKMGRDHCMTETRTCWQKIVQGNFRIPTVFILRPAKVVICHLLCNPLPALQNTPNFACEADTDRNVILNWLISNPPNSVAWKTWEALSHFTLLAWIDRLKVFNTF